MPVPVHPIHEEISLVRPVDRPAPEPPRDEAEEYVPRQITADDLDGSFEDAIAGTLVSVEDGQIVQGTVVKVDKDEVLLDIGYKSEGVIPSRELSIRNDVDPSEIVSMGDEIEALVLTKEDKDGRLDPVQEAGPVRAGLGRHRDARRKRTASSPVRSSRSSRAA